MQLLTMQKGEQQCLLYSVAMVLDESVAALMVEIGHDGMKKWWPELPVPYCYRGYHIQEIVDLFLARGYGLTPIELYPMSASQRAKDDVHVLWDAAYAQERFERLLAGRKGILIGQTANGGGHACAWDGSSVYDPNGRIYGLEQFHVQECWLM